MKTLIRELLHSAPFQSFVIHMADGRTFLIKHPDFVFASRATQSWVTVEDEQTGRLHLLSALLMTGIEYALDATMEA